MKSKEHKSSGGLCRHYPGISSSQLSKIENGKAKLTVETALKFAGILHVPAAMFLAEPTSGGKGEATLHNSP